MKKHLLKLHLGIALFVFALAACDSGATITPTVISDTATSSLPSIGRIAFYGHGIYVINADGASLTQLAEWGADEPAWSSDGRYIAFVSGGIYVMNADGTHQVHLADLDVDSNLAWSPDSLQIILSSFENDGTGKIYLINNVEESLQGKGKLGGSYIRLNRQGVDAQSITWSPDGRQIAFFYRRDLDTPYEIALLNVEEALQSAEGGEWTTLIEGQMPAWSPDGQHIAFMSGLNDQQGIYSMDANGNHPTLLASNAAYPAWSPDGRQIAFVSARDGNYEIYVMDADGSHQARLTNDSAVDLYPAWSPDGKQIAFVSERDGNQEIYVMNADGSNQMSLTNTPEDEWNPIWQPR